ncbi:divergent polysaccharide deacetylase family protein [Paenibacillus senegalimassiliensis]|uniref:divergent polysaccharide deacetylase family protein n=1 Tax=Paenibacillus senegalimassiliensis TaxID=1737426 RepID=UPI00073F6A8B|nr:divergent polysaccharide deacetylase family protein [Paenibacillus senegalimassiliensis]
MLVKTRCSTFIIIAALCVGSGLEFNLPMAKAASSTLFLPSASAVVKSKSVTAGPNSRIETGKRGEKSRKLVVIIDDLGNNMGGTEEMLSLPVHLTVAVMPFLPTSREDALRAHKLGHDVLVHLPLEPKQGRPEWLGPGAILTRMTDAEVRQRVEAAIDQVPYAVGINNHMGSKVTGDDRVMSVILEVCRERGLFFVDSKTNYRSVVGRLSLEKGLPQLENHLFLDDLHTENHMAGQLRKAQQLLESRDNCVLIGHVGVHGRKSAAVLKKYIPLMQADGVEFIGIRQLAQEQISPGVSPGPGFTLP